MDDEPPSSGLLSRFFSRKEALLEQSLSREAYEEYKNLLMRARPEVKGSKIVVRLPDGVVELDKNILRVKARDRRNAEKILRNLHHYSSPPSLWPAYGLSYSIRRRRLVL